MFSTALCFSHFFSKCDYLHVFLTIPQFVHEACSFCFLFFMKSSFPDPRNPSSPNGPGPLKLRCCMIVDPIYHVFTNNIQTDANSYRKTTGISQTHNKTHVKQLFVLFLLKHDPSTPPVIAPCTHTGTVAGLARRASGILYIFFHVVCSAALVNTYCTRWRTDRAICEACFCTYSDSLTEPS